MLFIFLCTWSASFGAAIRQTIKENNDWSWSFLVCFAGFLSFWCLQRTKAQSRKFFGERKDHGNNSTAEEIHTPYLYSDYFNAITCNIFQRINCNLDFALVSSTLCFCEKLAWNEEKGRKCRDKMGINPLKIFVWRVIKRINEL